VSRVNCAFREFIEIIEAHGFREQPQTSGTSHRKWVWRSEKNAAGGQETRVVTVAYHRISDTPKPGTLDSTYRKADCRRNCFGSDAKKTILLRDLTFEVMHSPYPRQLAG